MSWRIILEPAYFGTEPGDTDGADAVIPVGATDAEVDDVARKYAWSLPLKVWTPSESDPRLLRLAKYWEEEMSMGPGDYQVIIKEPK